MSFDKPTKVEKVWIGSVDAKDKDGIGGETSICAQYNPGTLEVSQNVPWKKPDAATGSGGGGSGPPPPATSQEDKNYMVLEFTGAEGRTLSLELLFDGVEDNRDVSDQVRVLNTLASVRDHGSSDEKMRRPHHCVVVWPNVLPRFTCVIEGLTTKYTMFAPNGTPLRATCTVKLKEAHGVERAPAKGGKK